MSHQPLLAKQGRRDVSREIQTVVRLSLGLKYAARVQMFAYLGGGCQVVCRLVACAKCGFSNICWAQ